MVGLVGWVLMALGGVGYVVGFAKGIGKVKFWSWWIILAMVSTVLFMTGMALVIDGEELLS